MKKAVAGDMAALAEYPALLEEAQELCDKLDKAQNDMSTSQVNRYLKITKKMTDAALEMVPSSSSSDLDLDFDIDF